MSKSIGPEQWTHATIRLLVCAIVLLGCRSKQEEPSDAPAAAAPAVPAAAVTQASWAPDALEELVAPIALYPDQLLGQILAASVNAQEVLDAGNWLLENQSLKGAELDEAAQKVGFGPAMRALLPFPTVIDMMCQQIDWTRQVGSAFTSDQKGVLDAVQRLRAQAADVGNLTSTPEQTVERKTEDGKEFVEVKPANPEVVYVPQYDPQLVYTTPPPVVYTPSAPSAAPPATAAPAAPAPATATTESENTVSTSTAVAGGLLAFGVGVLVGTAIDDDDYYYPHWGASAVYYGPRPYYPPAYVYRPVYGSGLRPAHHYAPGADYRYRHNDSRNVVINNNDYFNRFDNQKNLRNGETRSPLNASQQPATRGRSDRATDGGRAESWKGKPTYAGARENARAEPRTATSDRQSTTPAERKSTTAAGKSSASERRSTTPERRSTAPAERKSTAPERRSATAERAAPAAAAGQVVRPSQAPARPTAGPIQDAPDRPDRGYGTADDPRVVRGAGTSAEPQRGASSASTAQRDQALSGAGQRGSGSFDRAASARGHASASAGRGRAGRAGRRGR